jgi:hypothetical protein
MAATFFTDFFIFSNDSMANFSDTGISLKSDRESLFANLSDLYLGGVRFLQNYSDFPGETTNEHFIVWMRAAAFPSFVKLFAICEFCDLAPGDYSVEIRKSYPEWQFDGRRSLFLVGLPSLGSRSSVIGLAFCIAGGVFALIGLLFAVYLVWFWRAGGHFSGLGQAVGDGDVEVGILASDD